MNIVYSRADDGNGYAFNVVHDTDDTELPIKIENEDGAWLSRSEAIATANAIYNALRVSTGHGVAASAVSFNEGLMRLAAVHGKTVTFRYAKGEGRIIEQRTLAPTDVKEVAGHVVFTGYDPDRDEPRAYRIDRMKGEVTIL